MDEERDVRDDPEKKDEVSQKRKIKERKMK